MKVLVVGTGAVGAAVAAVAKRRSFFERMTFADLDPARPAALLARDGDDRFAAAQVDAGDKDALVGLLRETGADAVLNAADPRFNPPIFDAAFEARLHVSRHGDDALEPHPTSVELRLQLELDIRTSAGRSAACSRSSALASSRASPTSSPATRPTTCSTRSTRSGCATAPTSSSRATTSLRPSRSGRRSRSA